MSNTDLRATPQARQAAQDVAAIIDAQPVSGFQIRVLLACAAVLFMDGFDTQAIGYVAPELVRVWGVPRPALGPVLTAGLFGLMIGALLLGPLADRIGRKRIILLSTLTFGVLSLATMLATNISELTLLRFVTGLGLGGALPNAVSMSAEYCPQRSRATLVMTMFCGFSVGAAVGGFIASALLPAYGWSSVFLVGGVMPLLALPFLALRLPESLRFLALSGRADRDVGAILSSMFPALRFAPDARFTVSEHKLDGIPVLHLLQGGRLVVTLLLWVVFFMSLLDIYFLASWLPTVLNGLGASISLSVFLGSLLQVGGVIGALVLGRFIDRFYARAMAAIYVLGTVAIAAIGQSGPSVALVGISIFLAGFCTVGGQGAANALAASYYPTSMRSTGVGWAFGIGRIGSILGPFLGGTLLALKWQPDHLFLAAALPAMIAALAAFALSFVGIRVKDTSDQTP